MGGRGASSSRVSGSGAGGSGGGLLGGMQGLDVTVNGETTRYYFASKNGENYYQVGTGGRLNPTPQNMTAKEFMDRVKANGGAVKKVSAKEKAKDEVKYQADRKETDKFLDKHWYDARPRYGMKGH